MGIEKVFIIEGFAARERQAPAWPVGCRMISIAELELSVPGNIFLPIHFLAKILFVSLCLLLILSLHDSLFLHPLPSC